MRTRAVFFLVLSTLVVLASPSFGRQAHDRMQNVILVGWDGAQRNHLKESLGRGELPNFKRLIDAGSYVDIDVQGTTDTKAGWTQILTGYNPEVTGVYSNSRYQPIPAGYTIGERLKEQFGPEFVAAAVIGKKGHVDADAPERVQIQPKTATELRALRRAQQRGVNARTSRELSLQARFIGGKIIQEGGKYFVDIPGKPYYHTKAGLDLFINGLTENSRVAEKAMELLGKYKDKRFFFFVHFAEVDHNGHQSGENSSEYNDALISCDNWTGKIMQKLDELKLADKTLVYITADHGFDEGMKHHRDAPYVFLATNDTKVKRNGLRVDITPTILWRLGIDLRKFDPPLDGKSLGE